MIRSWDSRPDLAGPRKILGAAAAIQLRGRAWLPRQRRGSLGPASGEEHQDPRSFVRSTRHQAVLGGISGERQLVIPRLAANTLPRPALTAGPLKFAPLWAGASD